MGDHQTNRTALLANTLPPFPPRNRDGAGEIRYTAAPKKFIFLHFPDEIDEEQLKAHAAMCAANGLPAQELHEVGKPLPPEKCDVVFVCAAGWVDIDSIGPGKSPRAGAHVLPGEMARVDMVAFLERAEASLGPEDRIIRPGLKLVNH
jgi:hypothetical protein